MATKRFKVVLLGEGRVGKTSILLRFVRGEYDDKQISTLQASYLEKSIKVNSTNVKLSVWDTAGQERFHALGPIYYRDADGALLVYDITDAESFKKVKNWVKELRRIVGNKIAINIAGNKIDLEKNRHVDRDAAEAYAASVGASHMHTSAKQNKNLDEIFADLARKIIASKPGRGGGGMKFEDEDDKKGKKTTINFIPDESSGSSGGKSGCC